MSERMPLNKAEKQKTEFNALSAELPTLYGYLKEVIGTDVRLSRHGAFVHEEYELFDLALGPPRGTMNTTDILDALDHAIYTVREAIGRLEAESSY